MTSGSCLRTQPSWKTFNAFAWFWQIMKEETCVSYIIQVWNISTRFIGLTTGLRALDTADCLQRFPTNLNQFGQIGGSSTVSIGLEKIFWTQVGYMRKHNMASTNNFLKTLTETVHLRDESSQKVFSNRVASLGLSSFQMREHFRNSRDSMQFEIFSNSSPSHLPRTCSIRLSAFK